MVPPGLQEVIMWLLNTRREHEIQTCSDKERRSPTEKKGLRSMEPAEREELMFNRILPEEILRSRSKKSTEESWWSLNNFINKLYTGNRQAAPESVWLERRGGVHCPCYGVHGGACQKSRGTQAFLTAVVASWLILSCPSSSRSAKSVRRRKRQNLYRKT